MTDRASRGLAWLLCTLTLLVLASSLVLVLLGWSTPLPTGATTPWRDRALALVGIVGAPILGGLIASRRPHNLYGWLWLGFGLGLALQHLGATCSVYGRIDDPVTLPATSSLSHVLGMGGQLALILAPFLLLLFPTGRLPSRRWRPLAWASILCGTVVAILVYLFDSPDKVGGAVTVTVVVAVSGVFTVFVLSTVSLVVRYHRAEGMERQQLKWFALAAVIAVLVFLGGNMLGLGRLLGGTFSNMLEAFANTCLYTAVGVAILRYRLYDIDTIINRTLVYGSLTVSLALIYSLGVTAAQTLFQALTGQQRLPQFAVIVSTLVIAALFNPLRRRIQTIIDRRFYRKKYDARKVVETFSSRLRDETDLATLQDELRRIVAETMNPRHVSMWLHQPPPRMAPHRIETTGSTSPPEPGHNP